MNLKCSNRELLARNIKKYRKERNMSQVALASRVGTTQGVISELERMAFNPTLEVLNRVARGLQVKLPRLFE